MKASNRQKFKSPFRGNNLKVFLIFLLISTVIWVIVQFSQTYSQSIKIPFELVEVPQDKIPKIDKTTLDIRMKDNGFNLAWYGWMDSKLKIPVDSLPQNDSNFVINREFQRKLLSDQLGISEDEYNFIDENIRIPFDRKETKKVPVVAHIEFNFAPGYGAKNKLVILPDSINITGSLDSLAKISKVDTKKMTLTNIKEKKSGKIKLQKKSGQIKYFQNEVSFSQNVAKFTEGRFEVPINLINIPENWNIEIFPKTAVVIFTATLSDYKDISESDFRVVCDFQNGIDSDRDFLIPELVIYPKDILNERLNVNRVDFIISK